MSKPYSLHIYTGVLAGADFVGSIEDQTEAWRRSTRFIGGYWLGSFVLRASLSKLTDIFYGWLGYHLEEKIKGDTSWEGMIYELELEHEGVTRRRSLDDLANSVCSVYIDENGDVQESSWYEEDESVAEYGKKQEIVTVDGIPATAAQAHAQMYLKENGWPLARATGISGHRARGPKLKVSVAGYIFTGNWRFETAGNGTTGNLSDYLSSVISTDCQFLTAIEIASNTLQVVKETATPMRAWDVMRELVELGDASLDPYIFQVRNDRKVVYEKMDTEPRYLWDGELKEMSGESVNPFLVVPGVVRDRTWAVGVSEPGSILGDARDMIVEEVEVGERSGITLKTGHYEEGDLMAAQLEYEEWMESWLEEEGR